MPAIKRKMTVGLGICVCLTAAALAAKHAATTTTPSPKPMHQDMNGLMMMGSVNRAVAVMVPTKGHKAHGEVYFQQEGQQVHITGYIAGLAPGSTHAIHAHEYGDITAPDGSSAGGHYNPEGYPHGLPPHTPREAGDFGNIKANPKGVAKIDITVSNITVAGMRNPVLGRSVIVHARRDDGSQPAGNAGARIAMGVIGVAQPKHASTQPATQPTKKPATQPSP